MPEPLAHLLDTLTQALRPFAGVPDTLAAELAACRYHAGRDGHSPVLVLVGGTGTGKSTLINRLVGQDVSAASVRRTYTAGAVAATPGGTLPDGFAGLPHQRAEQLPARGESGHVTIAQVDTPMPIVDTPDLDGDTPAHHEVAWRALRFADGVILVVTPEKYQLPEPRRVLELADRWKVPAVVVLNKLEDAAVAHDLRTQLPAGVPLFAVMRDDATSPVADVPDLAALKAELAELFRADTAARKAGLAARRHDLVDRVMSSVVEPGRVSRRTADDTSRNVRRLIGPPREVDVRPVTRELQDRLREKSVLWLMGPGRIAQRVINLPGMLARLPRSTWDMVSGRKAGEAVDAQPNDGPVDFPKMLADQLRLLQGRVADVIESSGLTPAGEWRLPPETAADVARREIEAMRQWLEQRWDSDPGDTRLMKKLLSILPGGKTVKPAVAEATPYLMTAYLAASGALFGHLDLAILGGYGVVTSVLERMSNEVRRRTQQANRAIADGFDAVARQQVELAVQAINASAPTSTQVDALEKAALALVK